MPGVGQDAAGLRVGVVRPARRTEASAVLLPVAALAKTALAVAAAAVAALVGAEGAGIQALRWL
jgi:hypothetical protein